MYTFAQRVIPGLVCQVWLQHFIHITERERERERERDKQLHNSIHIHTATQLTRELVVGRKSLTIN